MMARQDDEIVKTMSTENGAVIEAQAYNNEIELSMFDEAYRVSVSYLTHTEVKELVDLLEEML